MQFEDTVQNMLATHWPIFSSTGANKVPKTVLELEFRFGALPCAQILRAQQQYVAMHPGATVRHSHDQILKVHDDVRGVRPLGGDGAVAGTTHSTRYERKIQLGRNRWALYNGALNLDCVISQEHPVACPGNAQPNTTYKRRRVSVSHDGNAWRVDFTVRDDANGNVEVELVGGHDTHGADGARMRLATVQQLRRILQTLVVLLCPGAAGDVNRVSDLSGVPLGIAQRLQSKHLMHARRTAYDIMRNHMPVSLLPEHGELLGLASCGPCPTALVTPKVDGVRCVLYVAPGQDATCPVAQLFFRSSEIQCLPLRAAMGWSHADDRMAQPWILDCEVMPACRTVYVMDAFSTPTTSSVVMERMGLAQRQDVLQRDWHKYAPDTGGLLMLHLKPWLTMTPENVVKAANGVGVPGAPCDGVVIGFRGATRVFLKWKPVHTVDKVIAHVDSDGQRCRLDDGVNGECALLGDIRMSPDIGGLTWEQAGIVGEFAIQHPSGQLVGVRLRPDKKHGNGPHTVQDVRRSAAMGLVNADALVRWLSSAVNT